MYELAPDLFVEDSWVRFYGVHLSTRMAVVRLSGDRLFVYSPTFLTPDLKHDLEELGQISYVISPNKIHNQTLVRFLAAFPAAVFCAPPGLALRRPDLRCEDRLTDRPDPEWSDELDQALTQGNVFFSEALFLHRASRTLMVGDLVENLDRHTVASFALVLGRIFGVRKGPAPSPEFRLYTFEADEAERAFERPRSWDFDRIFLCHGGLIEEDAGAIFDAVCEEILRVARERNPLALRVLRWLSTVQ